MFCIRAALGHRVPDMFPFRGGISDYRMYVGHALSVEEIRRLAQDPAKKKCESFNEGGDAMEVDTFGKDCSWYVTAFAGQGENLGARMAGSRL